MSGSEPCQTKLAIIATDSPNLHPSIARPESIPFRDFHLGSLCVRLCRFMQRVSTIKPDISKAIVSTWKDFLVACLRFTYVDIGGDYS